MDEQQLLRDPDIEFTSEVIAEALSPANAAYVKFVEGLKTHDIQVDWRYYNDGNPYDIAYYFQLFYYKNYLLPPFFHPFLAAQNWPIIQGTRFMRQIYAEKYFFQISSILWQNLLY